MTSVHHLRSALAEAAPTRALPVGSRLHGGQYEVLGALSQSAFGINYYAVDHRHDRPVVVKEYLPTMLALRGAQATLVTASDEAAFQAGLRSFLHEARLLATCVQPGLIHVQRSWREHGTAYMAMPSHEAPTLRRVIGARGGPPDEAELRTWLMPILDALAALHAADCVHGDITPDSILITEAGALCSASAAAATRSRRRWARPARRSSRATPRPNSTRPTRRGCRARGPTCTRSPRCCAPR